MAWTRKDLIRKYGEAEADRILGKKPKSPITIAKKQAMKVAEKKRQSLEPVEKLSVVILRDFPSFNEVLNDAQTHWNKYQETKKKIQDHVIWMFKQQKKRVETPVTFHFKWFVSGKMDIDNIGFNQKFLIDAAVKAGVIPDDNQNYLVGPLIHDFQFNCIKSAVEITIETKHEI